MENKFTFDDLYKLTQWIEIAINKKTFTKDELKEVYPLWNKCNLNFLSMKRKLEYEELIKDDKKKDEVKL